MRYIGREEMEELKKLHDEGCKIKHLAKKFAISEATVSNYINGKTTPRSFRTKRGVRKKGAAFVRRYAVTEFVEEVFKDLPDEVLFQHVRECNFIG